MAAKKTTAKKKASTAARAKTATSKAVKPSVRTTAKPKTPKKLDDHTLLAQTLVFIFTMLSIIFAAMAFYGYS